MTSQKKKTIILIITIGTLVSGAAIGWLAIASGGYFTKGLMLAVAGGLIGGGLYMARGFYQAVINRQFDFERFIWWYLLRPAVSAAAGGIAFIIAFLALDIPNSFKNLPAFFLILSKRSV